MIVDDENWFEYVDEADTIPAIRATQPPKLRLWLAASTLEFVLGLLQPDLNPREDPSDKTATLAQRIRSWDHFSNRNAVQNANSTRGATIHHRWRTTASQVQIAADEMVRGLEEALSIAERDPRLADTARYLRGGPGVLVAQIHAPQVHENNRGLTIRCEYYVSGMQGEEGCLALHFCDIHGSPLPLFQAELPYKSFVQQRAGYRGIAEFTVTYDELKGPGLPDIGERLLLFKLIVYKRANQTLGWTQVFGQEYQLRVFVPGVSVTNVAVLRDSLDRDFKRVLRIHVEGTLAYRRGAAYDIGACFTDGNGSTLREYFSIASGADVEPLISRRIAGADIGPFSWDGELPYDKLPLSSTTPSYKGMIRLRTDRNTFELASFDF